MNIDHSSATQDSNSASKTTAPAPTPHKRYVSAEDGSLTKKIRSVIEVPASYSDAVRKKLAATSRTGQACDRCKERKMKCDTDPIACQPCRQKNLPCYTTDRVTGHSRERGQSDRAESELQFLREQNAAYHKKYGPLQHGDLQLPLYTPISDVGNEGSGQTQPRIEAERRDYAQIPLIPSSQYVGWPAPDHIEPLAHGPVNGTTVDVLDGEIDIADFPCEMLEVYDPRQLNIFNVSRTSIMNTTTGHQTIVDPKLPPKDEAMTLANGFLVVMSQYAPIVHRPTFIEMIHRIYDQPAARHTLAEKVQLVVILGIVTFQAAVRNHQHAKEKFEQSHYWIHYGLTWYRDLIRARSLQAMQALALILIHMRNMPKPGYTWSFANNLLVKAMELEYHRDPDQIELPPDERTTLAKELRKRVFFSILSICVITGCRVGKPAPWQFQHMDCPLPLEIRDTEISSQGLQAVRSGQCDYRPALFLTKLLPLYTELYNYIVAVRRSEGEYLKTVEALHTKIDAWKRDWDDSVKIDEPHVNLDVATLLMETWAAEYTLNLYHPTVCPIQTPEIHERHLDVCHRQAQRLLKSFHILSSKYKGVDFTWHSTVAYTMGFGCTLQYYRSKRGRLSPDQVDAMRNELKGWMSLVAYADLVMRTGNHLQHMFRPRVEKLENDYLTAGASSPSLSSPPHSHQLTPGVNIPNGGTSHNNISLETSPHPRSNVTPLSAAELRRNSLQQQQLPEHPPVLYTPSPHVNAGQAWPLQYLPTTNSAHPPRQAQNLHGPVLNAVLNPSTSILAGEQARFMGYTTPTSTVQNELMMYTPTHYTDGMSWPFITMPTEQIYDTPKG